MKVQKKVWVTMNIKLWLANKNDLKNLFWNIDKIKLIKHINFFVFEGLLKSKYNVLSSGTEWETIYTIV